MMQYAEHVEDFVLACLLGLVEPEKGAYVHPGFGETIPYGCTRVIPALVEDSHYDAIWSSWEDDATLLAR